MKRASPLPRLKPSPVPAIHPLAEYRAEGELARRYADMKLVLQVPWMGVVTMAFAHYPNFFAVLWRGLRPLAASAAFVAEAAALRRLVETRITALAPPRIDGRLAKLGYAPRELDQIRQAIEVFSHGNHLYFLIATAARFALEGGELSRSQAAGPTAPNHGPAAALPLTLMEAHHADAPTRALYDDVKAVLGLPFVNTDYRALARWPSYFALAWSDLRELAGGAAHEAICSVYHELAVDAVAERLANPGALDAASLRAAAEADAPLDEVRDVVRLFQWLLPGLAVNVAFFRAQLA